MRKMRIDIVNQDHQARAGDFRRSLQPVLRSQPMQPDRRIPGEKLSMNHIPRPVAKHATRPEAERVKKKIVGRLNVAANQQRNRT